MKRQLLSIFLSLTMILSMVPSVWAADETQQDDTDDTAAQETKTPSKPAMNGNCGATDADDVTWKLEQNNTDSDSEKPTYTLTISGSGAMADYYAQYVQRAAEFDGDIAPWRRALLSDTNAERTTEEVVPITEVVIGDGVTRIGSGAFAYTELTGTVTFNANVTSYGDGVFARDTSIKAVDWTNFKPTEKITDGWANKVYTEEHIAIPYAFFDGCSSLDTSIVDGTTYSGQLVLPDTIEAIYVAAFRGTGFSTVDFSDGLSSIQAVGSYAITKLANMTEFTYPGNVDFYGVNDEGQNNVIQGGGIQKLTIAKEVTTLPVSFCTNTENLTVIEFESGSQLTEIGKTAFYNTQALKSIDIPSTVTSIGESAFADCFSLEKIELGQIESFGQNTFARCSSLETVKIQGSPNVTYPSNMFGTWGTGHSAAPLKTLEIGAGKIQFSLNSQKDSIETIILGNGVTEIPANFAHGCTELTSISLPDALTSVPANAFYDCSSLKKVGISENSELQSIGSNAFQNSGLTQIYIPKNVTFIGTGAFNRTPITVFDMSDVLAESMAVGKYAINNWYDPEKPQEFPAWKDNFKCIYVSNSGAAASVKAQTGSCKYAFFVTNGGSVDATKTGFDAVYRTGYTAEWYDNETCTGSPVTGNPVTGETYYAKWIKSSNVTLTSDPAAENGKVSAAYNPNGSVTLSVQKPGAGWLYTWMKNGEQISAAGNSLTLYTPSDSGNYSVKVVAGGSSTDVWISNPVKVTITKAAGTASVSMDGWAYGETAKTPVPTSATNGTDNVTYLYKVKDAADSTYSAAVPTAAGSYTVKATFPATENYEETAATTDFTIAQAAPTVSITAEPASLVGGGTVKLTVTTNAPAKVVPTCDGVTVTENSDGTFSAVLPNETKTYTFTASYNGDANHKEAFGTCQVSVTRRSSSGGSSSSGSSYAVSVPTAQNGDVTVSPKSASKGSTVTVTVKPDSGYVLETLTVVDQNGDKIKLTDKGDGKYTFTMPGSKVTVSAEFVEEQAASIFADVPADAYYAKAVEWAVKKGITNGKANGLFGSNDPYTRGQIVTFLWRAAGSPTPKGTAKVPGDVLPGSYCYDAVAWALENGITNGLADGTFGVNNTCTRGQSVTFLYRAMGTAPTTVNGFTDVESNAFCAEAVAWAVENGVTNGTSASTFSPSNGCTRAQIVTFLFRAYNK